MADPVQPLSPQNRYRFIPELLILTNLALELCGQRGGPSGEKGHQPAGGSERWHRVSGATARAGRARWARRGGPGQPGGQSSPEARPGQPGGHGEAGWDSSGAGAARRLGIARGLGRGSTGPGALPPPGCDGGVRPAAPQTGGEPPPLPIMPRAGARAALSREFSSKAGSGGGARRARGPTKRFQNHPRVTRGRGRRRPMRRRGAIPAANGRARGAGARRRSGSAAAAL